MTLLISKVQFKRSEKGEFHDIAQRNLDETISLILNYPWNTERNLAPVELTCPSVTVAHSIGTFLKVGPYFSGKFSLYYLDTNNSVYLKTADTLEDVIVWVKAFFEQEGKLNWSEKYGFAFRPASHFRTNTFEYTVDRKAIFRFFRFPIFILPFMALFCLLYYLDRPESFNVLAPVTLLSLHLLMASPLVYLFSVTCRLTRTVTFKFQRAATSLFTARLIKRNHIVSQISQRSMHMVYKTPGVPGANVSYF